MATQTVNSMTAAWCAARRDEIRAWLNSPRPRPEVSERQWRAWVIELMSQLDGPPAGITHERLTQIREAYRLDTKTPEARQSFAMARELLVALDATANELARVEAERDARPPVAPEAQGLGAGLVLLTPEQRAELRRLAEAATPGPWEAVEDAQWSIWNSEKLLFGEYEHDNGLYCETGYVQLTEQDAAYIAAVHPALALDTLTYIEQLESRLATLEAAGAAGAGREAAEELSNQLGEYFSFMLSASRLTDEEQEAYQWADGYPGYPHLLATAIKRMADAAWRGPKATKPTPVAPAPQQQVEAGRADCPNCGEGLAWDATWAHTGNVCKVCGYDGWPDL